MRVYTDGSCVSRVGGWAWVAEDGRSDKGTVFPATNNQMELQAVIEAIKANGQIDVVTDSKYVSECFLQGWWKNWLQTDYKNGKVANEDQWRILIPLWRLDRFTISWTRGHDGNEFNEIADRLAGEAARDIPF